VNPGRVALTIPLPGGEALAERFAQRTSNPPSEIGRGGFVAQPRSRGPQNKVHPTLFGLTNSFGGLGGAAANFGYGAYGASRKKIGLEEWHARSANADWDITANLPILRMRSRDLFMGCPIAAAVILALRTSVVGNGIAVLPQVDARVLGLSKTAAAEINKHISDEFELFAATVEADWNRRSTFYQLQDLVFTSACISGDVLVLLPMKNRPGGIYDTRVRLIEADRVASPVSRETGPGAPETAAGAPRIFGGVELEEDGQVVAYWIARHHPLAEIMLAADPRTRNGKAEYSRILAFGEETGRPAALLVGEMERPEQRRAVPLLAKCLTEAKNLQRYVESTTVQNVIKSYFCSFITSAMPSENMFNGMVDDDYAKDLVERNPYNVLLAPGMVNFLRPGDTIDFPIHAGPEDQFDPYVTAVARLIGASTGVPYEVLLMSFNASYSASRASMLQFWNRVKVLRQLLVDQFCQPTYTAWMMEAVAGGNIDAPGFFEDPRIRTAWLRAAWSGASQGSIDPLKDAQAAALRIKLGISTQERECYENNGGDWRAIAEQQGLELEVATSLGLPYPRNQTSEMQPIPAALITGEDTEPETSPKPGEEQ
jgi:lambda family phage portal protein